MKSCNPANLTAKIMGTVVSRGGDVDASTFKNMPGEAKGVFADTLVESSANELAATPRSLTKEELNVAKMLGLDSTDPEAQKGVKAMLHETRLMNDLLGDEVIDQADRIYDRIMAAHGKMMEIDSRAGWKDYQAEVKDLIEEFDDRIPKNKKVYWESYKDFLRQGGGIYARPPQTSNQAEQFGRAVVNNVVSNQVTLSPTVIFGNMMELSKAAILYPDTAFQALPKMLAAKGGFGKIPELESMGIYRSDQVSALTQDAGPIKKAGNWLSKADNAMRQSIAFTSRPMQAWAYYAGEIRGGQNEGIKAVERVSFSSRPMNPTLGQARGTGLFTQLLHFSTMSAKMHAGLLKDVARPLSPSDRARAIVGLGLLHGGTAAVMAMNAGMEGKDPSAAAIIGGMNSFPLLGPAIYEALKMHPDFKEWTEENAPSLLTLVQTTASPGFTGAKIAGGKLSRFAKETKKAIEAFADGDLETAARESTRAFMTSQVFFKNPLGNRLFQSVSDFMLDANEGRFDIGTEGAQQAAGRLTPFYKDVVRESKQ